MKPEILVIIFSIDGSINVIDYLPIRDKTS